MNRTPDVGLVVPVGTSLLTTWIRRLDSNLQLPRDWEIPGLSSDAAREPDQAAWIARLRPDLRRAESRTSAEIDSIRLWLAQRPDAKVREIKLLVSDTKECRWVSEVIAALLPDIVGRDVSVQRLPVPRLNAGSMRAGLTEFIRVAAKAIKECRESGRRAVVDATPGFKAEASLLTLLAALLDAESFYLHERMSAVVTVPALPLRWNVPPREVGILGTLGEAASRDSARSLGVWNHPELAPFIENTGSGDDDIWSLSALGQLLLESHTGFEDATPPERRHDLSPQIEASSKERGHLPNDAVALAEDIWNKLRFATKVRIGTWRFVKLKPGLLSARAGDLEEGILRLCLETADKRNGIQMVNFVVLTTVSGNELQWHTARELARKAFGEVSLREELAAELSEKLASQRVGDAEPRDQPEDFQLLATEALLEEALNGTRQENDALTRRLDAIGEQHRQEIEAINKQLRQRTESANQLRENNRQLKSELAELRRQLDDTAYELASLRSQNEGASEPSIE